MAEADDRAISQKLANIESRCERHKEGVVTVVIHFESEGIVESARQHLDPTWHSREPKACEAQAGIQGQAVRHVLHDHI